MEPTITVQCDNPNDVRVGHVRNGVFTPLVDRTSVGVPLNTRQFAFGQSLGLFEYGTLDVRMVGSEFKGSVLDVTAGGDAARVRYTVRR